MQTIVTIESLKKYKGETEISLPERAIVTAEARTWAESNGIKIRLGKKLLPPLNTDKAEKSEINDEKRVVISVLGEDKVGIIAGVSNVLAKHNINILDITQTSLQGLFSMVMVVDAAKSTVSFSELKKVLNEKGNDIGVRIDAQEEAVFSFMHRI